MLVEIAPDVFVNPDYVVYVTTSRQKVEGKSEPQDFVAIVLADNPTIYVDKVTLAHVIEKLTTIRSDHG